jgi:ATP-binding cassette subfamily B (MDR/TAP) protein 1
MTMDAKKSISPAETLASPANSVPDHPPTPPAASWKHLFAFTRWPTHLPTFLIAVAASLAVAGLKTALSVVLGRVFDVIAGFGSGRLQDDQTMAQIAHWCMVLTALGAGTWLANSLFLAAWAVFGELQGFSARHSVFANLANKDMAWFDAQTEGVSSLLVQIET